MSNLDADSSLVGMMAQCSFDEDNTNQKENLAVDGIWD